MVDGEAGKKAESVGCSVRRGSCVAWATSGGVVCSLADSETRGLLDGVDGPVRPSQRLDRFEDGVAVGFGAAAAEAGLGR